jgi:hypothetical protein
MILRTTPAVRSLLWLIPVVLLWMLVCDIPSVWAQAPAAFGEAETAAKNAFCKGRPVVVAMISIAVLGLAATIMFGKINWGWVFTIVGASALIVLADKIINWLTGYSLTC